MGLLASGISDYLFPLALLLIIGSLLLRSRKYLRRRRGSEPVLVKASQSIDPTIRERLAGASELSTLQVQIHELSRSAKAELDTKMVVLEQLIQQARSEREQLESVLQRAGQQTSPDDAAPPIRLHSLEPAEGFEGIDPLEAEIYALADAGLAEEEIALRVGNPVGEIAQILSRRDA